MPRPRIAIRPDVLLIDEPGSVIDPLSTKRIEAPIAELRRRYAIVIVTQQAVRVSQRTALFHMGSW